jgi:hypothetical protein
MTEPPVVPDDTPTRLQQSDEYYLAMAALDQYPVVDKLSNSTSVVFRIHQLGHKLEAAEADVSRLQQERDNLGILLKRGLDIMEEAKAERAKLLEENALLRRSLEMLTKQMAEPVYTPPAEVSPCPSSLKTSSRPNTPTIPMRSMAP